MMSPPDDGGAVDGGEDTVCLHRGGNRTPPGRMHQRETLAVPLLDIAIGFAELIGVSVSAGITCRKRDAVGVAGR